MISPELEVVLKVAATIAIYCKYPSAREADTIALVTKVVDHFIAEATKK